MLQKTDFTGVLKPRLRTGYQITKEILALTHFGKFYITLYTGSVVPSEFSCINATPNSGEVDTECIGRLKNEIEELRDLQHVDIEKSPTLKQPRQEMETISEVTTGENWYDHSPTSEKYFLGRKNLFKTVFGLFGGVSKGSAEKRVFYIEGKSGWGKSSFIATIRGKARNRRYKNQFFVYAADYRSALSNNFSSIAFSKLIESAAKEGFIPKSVVGSKVNVASTFDILGSNSLLPLFDYLRKNNKVLILVFDQFEDAFRQGTLFKSFYKLLNDANELKENLVVGFSWKSEINIPADHEAYHLWQQAKGNALQINMPEFDLADMRGAIRQLESEINASLTREFKQKLIEVSQGFPWLMKKLCIHVLEQYRKGISLDLLEQEHMNIKALFQQDLEKLGTEEAKLLKYIAERAYKGNHFDIIYAEDNEDTLKALTNKRLIIRSGTKYNIYWDIFRDYLVEGDVPEIGEIYLLRSYPAQIYDLLNKISERGSISINELEKAEKGRLGHGTYQNYFRLLKDLGVITPANKGEVTYDDDRPYEINDRTLITPTADKFKAFIHIKFKKYRPYVRLVKNKSDKIKFEDVIRVLKESFPGRKYSSATWVTYAQTFEAWLKYANFKLQIERSTSRGSSKLNNPKDRLLSNYPKPVLDFIYSLSNDLEPQNTGRHEKLRWDVSILGLGHTHDSGEFRLLDELYDKDKGALGAELAVAASGLTHVSNVAEFIGASSKKVIAKDVVNEFPELFKTAKSDSYKKTLSGVLKSWAIFIEEGKE